MNAIKLLLAGLAIGLMVLSCGTKQEVEAIEDQQTAVNNNEKTELPTPGSNGETPDQGSYDAAPLGDWLPIQLDKAELRFTAEGGTDTIISLNYPFWWICDGFDDAWNVDGKIEYKNFVFADKVGGPYYSSLDSGWYVAVISYECKNELVVTVKKNTTGEPRQATLEMEAGDAFTRVKIFQE